MTKGTKKAVSAVMTLVMVLAAFNLYADDAFALGTKVKLKKANQPKATITQGSRITVKGKIVSNKKMKRVEIGIVKASTNKWTKYKYDKKINKKAFNIRKAARKLKFNKLAPGEYRYRIYVHTSSGVRVVLNRKFVVKKKAVKKTAKKKTTKKKTTKSVPVAKPAITVPISLPVTVSGTSTGMTNSGDKAVLRSYNYPKTLNNGAVYNVKGKITCTTEIKRVEIGIVVTATNKWSEYKYENKYVNATTFDVSQAAPVLRFDKLPAGKFTYRIYAHTESGVAIVLNQPFEVKSTGKANGAIKWATKIANNDQYTYGKGYGGYFTCPICAKKTEKKKHTKFTCMPFLAAAYAHGTGDKSLMNGGRHIMNLHNGNFKGTLGEAWFKVGLCKDLTIDELLPGDVVIKYSASNESGHAWMYGGGDKIIEAVPAGIRVLNTGAAAKLRRYGTSEGSTSKNYVMRYRK